MDAAALDQSIQVLGEHKDKWARMPVARKVDYLQQVIDGCVSVAARQVATANAAKGISNNSPAGGEEWEYPYLVIRLLRLLKGALQGLSDKGRIDFPKSAVRTRESGQVVVQGFPLGIHDKVLYRGYTGEVWLEQGVTVDNLQENTASFYRQQNPAGKVAVVLGAGNNAAIGPSDLIHKLFVEGQVCMYKHHPVNEYLAPFMEGAFGFLIKDGFLRTAKGGPDVGDYLCFHRGVDEIHLTGSDRTYEAIVFGPGEAGQRAKEANQRRLTKRVTAELGNVAPLIIVPGDWSAAELKFQAQNIATQLVHNCGFNCLTARVLVLQEGWAQSQQLLEELSSVLKTLPQRRAYYPGSDQRYDALLSANKHIKALGQRSKDVIPYTLVLDVDPADRSNPCFATECFVPVLAQTALPGADAAEFLVNAARFSNEVLWGTLNCSVIAPPRVQKSLGQTLDQAVADLRYGTVAVNQWSALSYIWCTTWGAYPGHVSTDIQSGIGKVRDWMLLDRAEKSVIYGPIKALPRPPWYVTNTKTHKVFPKLVPVEARPSMGGTLGVAVAALGG